MLDKLDSIKRRFEEITISLSQPETASDQKKYVKLTRERSEMEPIVNCFIKYQEVLSNIEGNQELVSDPEVDPELKELAEMELEELLSQQKKLKDELTILLIPKDPDDDKSIILEIRAGTGGDEAGLFAGDLLNMYVRYTEKRGWKLELLDSSSSDVGGYKEVVYKVNGHGAYSAFKFESGVHRVQRVPKTETQGRVHTSTCTVAVLPEAQDIDIDIDQKDLRIDVFRSSGPGGQSVNTTDSAVRVTHVPTGIVATCQDGKSQHKNKAKALEILRARVFQKFQQEEDSKRSENRKNQIGTGERSEKIRTYNYPQGRVTDHRISLTVYQLDTMLSGELELVTEPLTTHYRAEALKESSSEEY